MTSHLQKLYRHMAWADDQVISGLRDDSGSDSQALDYFSHVIGAEHIWLSRISGEPARLAVWPTLTIDECAWYAAENATGFLAIIESATPNDLTSGISYVNSAGRAFTTPLEEILLHVALHSGRNAGRCTEYFTGGAYAASPQVVALAPPLRLCPQSSLTRRK
jgi:uncharacterized damage-inducible protein DinB